MEALITVVSIILLVGLFSFPILLFLGIKKWNRLKFDFMAYLLLGGILTAGIMWAFAWWADYSDQLLLSHYGYDFEGMNHFERYAKVEPKNIEKVQDLEIASYGIGWPIKAFLNFVFYSPYLLFIYFGGQFVRKN